MILDDFFTSHHAGLHKDSSQELVLADVVIEELDQKLLALDMLDREIMCDVPAWVGGVDAGGEAATVRSQLQHCVRIPVRVKDGPEASPVLQVSGADHLHTQHAGNVVAAALPILLCQEVDQREANFVREHHKLCNLNRNKSKVHTARFQKYKYKLAGAGSAHCTAQPGCDSIARQIP